jgi:ribosomal protein L34E
VYQYTKKRASGPKCPVTGKKIQGVSTSRVILSLSFGSNPLAYCSSTLIRSTFDDIRVS